MRPLALLLIASGLATSCGRRAEPVLPWDPEPVNLITSKRGGSFQLETTRLDWTAYQTISEECYYRQNKRGYEIENADEQEDLQGTYYLIDFNCDPEFVRALHGRYLPKKK